MSELLPLRTAESEMEHQPGPTELGLDDPATGTLFATLSCEAGKQIVRVLAERPLPQARIADRVNTSLQNVQYHVSRLREAGLVEVVTTEVSCKGAEMNVYALAGDPLLVTVDGDLGWDEHE